MNPVKNNTREKQIYPVRHKCLSGANGVNEKIEKIRKLLNETDAVATWWRGRGNRAGNIHDCIKLSLKLLDQLEATFISEKPMYLIDKDLNKELAKPVCQPKETDKKKSSSILTPRRYLIMVETEVLPNPVRSPTSNGAYPCPQCGKPVEILVGYQVGAERDGRCAECKQKESKK